MPSITNSNHLVFAVWKRGTVSTEAKPWRNTYEFSFVNPPTGTEVDNMASFLIEFERRFHLEDVRFLRVSISSWLPDSKPYNPFTFRTFYPDPLTQLGTRPIVGDRVDRDIVLKVARQTEWGNPGKLAYRGCLAEGDIVTAASGEHMRTQPSGVTTNFGDAVAYLESTLDPFTGNPGYEMSLINAQPPNPGEEPPDPPIPQSRRVTNLILQGAGINRSNHKYFDVS